MFRLALDVVRKARENDKSNSRSSDATILDPGGPWRTGASGADIWHRSPVQTLQRNPNARFDANDPSIRGRMRVRYQRQHCLGGRQRETATPAATSTRRPKGAALRD